jgi:hypothetical protein
MHECERRDAKVALRPAVAAQERQDEVQLVLPVRQGRRALLLDPRRQLVEPVHQPRHVE